MIYKTENDLVLDIHQMNIHTVFTKQYDNETRYLHIKVCDSNVPINLSSYVVKIKGKTPKGHIIFKECTKNSDGTITVELDQNMLFDKGNVYCEIMIFDSTTEEVISTMPFIIHVKSTVFTDEDISNEDYNALNDLIKKEQELANKYDSMSEAIQSLSDLLNEISGGLDLGDLNVLRRIANHTFVGRDLTQVYAEEISNFSNEWEWIETRIELGELEGVYVNDYIPFIVNGNTYKAHILGILNTYKNGITYRTVDFMTSEPYATSSIWTQSAIAPSSGAYITSSTIYNVLNETIYPSLPESMKSVLKDKEIEVPTRGANGENDTGAALTNLGKLWLLFEPEIFGRSSLSTNTYDYGFTQYPLFRLYPMAKVVTNGSSQVSWWTYSGAKSQTSKVITVNDVGVPQITNANELNYFPLCFRVSVPIEE